MVCQCLDLPLSAGITVLKGQLQRSHGHLVDHLQNTTLKSVRCSGETDKFSTTIYKKYYKKSSKSILYMAPWWSSHTTVVFLFNTITVPGFKG